MISFAGQSLGFVIGVFAVAAFIVLIAGTRLTRFADRFADVTGMGEALTGAVLLGAITSLSGSVMSVAAAMDGRAELAVSNAVGGIAAQTMFLALADMAYRRVNLEHAAASVGNMLSGTMLIVMLSGVLAAYLAPPLNFFGIHPVTVVLFAVYLASLRMVSSAHDHPMWYPVRTSDTRQDEPDESERKDGTIWVLTVSILGLGLVVGFAGFIIAGTAAAIIDKTSLNAGIVGTLFTAVATSTPELVTTIAAVRRGALTLAVGGILGGNTFDVLFIAFSDMAYTNGSIYHAVSESQIFILVLSILMTAVLLLGLLHRERRGFGGIGFESVFLILIYFAGVGVLPWL